MPFIINPLTPNDPYMGRTAPLTSKRCILYIYSTNIGTEYFKHGIHSPFFSLQNAVCFIILIYLVPVLFTFYIQDVLKLKKQNSGATRLTHSEIQRPGKTSSPPFTRTFPDSESRTLLLECGQNAAARSARMFRAQFCLGCVLCNLGWL